MGRFKCLVESEEDREIFKAKYRIPPTVGMRYVAQGEWVDDRKTGEVVIPMIAFIEGGMTIPIGTITRNYLRFFRLSPTQCAPNMFRVLGSIKVKYENEFKFDPSRCELGIQPTPFDGAGVLP